MRRERQWPVLELEQEIQQVVSVIAHRRNLSPGGAVRSFDITLPPTVCDKHRKPARVDSKTLAYWLAEPEMELEDAELMNDFSSTINGRTWKPSFISTPVVSDVGGILLIEYEGKYDEIVADQLEKAISANLREKYGLLEFERSMKGCITLLYFAPLVSLALIYGAQRAGLLWRPTANLWASITIGITTGALAGSGMPGVGNVAGAVVGGVVGAATGIWAHYYG